MSGSKLVPVGALYVTPQGLEYREVLLVHLCNQCDQPEHGSVACGWMMKRWRH